MSPVQGISVTPPAIPRPPAPATATAPSEAGSFQAFFADSIQEVNSAQLQADQAVEALFTGGEVNPAEVLSAVKKADLAFRMLMQIRNKLVAAYEEVKNIRV